MIDSTSEFATTTLRTVSRPPILVVEDEMNDIALVERAFAQAGVKAPVRFLCDGAEVVDYLEGKPPFDNREKCPMPRLLLLDLRMPKVSGWEVLARLRRQPRLKPQTVIVFSESDCKADRERALAEGADFYLTKPADWTEFAAVIHSIVQAVASAICSPTSKPPEPASPSTRSASVCALDRSGDQARQAQ